MNEAFGLDVTAHRCKALAAVAQYMRCFSAISRGNNPAASILAGIFPLTDVA